MSPIVKQPPYTLDAWIDPVKISELSTVQAQNCQPSGIEEFIEREQIGHEISVTGHFYKSTTMPSMEEIRTDISGLERELDELMEIVG